MTATATSTTPTAKDQAAALLGQVAGHVSVRTVEIGLRHGILAELADHADGSTADDLAARLHLDAFYTRVWCRAALAAEVLESDDDARFTLAPHMATLLLDRDATSYIGGVFTVMTTPEIFDWFADRLPTGDRIWWDHTSNAFIDAVSNTGRPFYLRLIPTDSTGSPASPTPCAPAARCSTPPAEPAPD